MLIQISIFLSETFLLTRSLMQLNLGSSLLHFFNFYAHFLAKNSAFPLTSRAQPDWSAKFSFFEKFLPIIFFVEFFVNICIQLLAPFKAYRSNFNFEIRCSRPLKGSNLQTILYIFIKLFQQYFLSNVIFEIYIILYA